MKGVVLGLGLIGLASGCGNKREPAAPVDRATWHVRGVEAPAGSPPVDLGVKLVGVPGYVRTTLVIEQPADKAAGVAARAALYDSLFPVGPEARIRLAVAPPVASATEPRVTFRVESAGIASESFVEPAVPFFAPGAVVMWTPALAKGQPLAEGAEVEIGRWSVALGPDTTVAVVRIHASRRPIGARLKGAGSPPS